MPKFPVPSARDHAAIGEAAYWLDRAVSRSPDAERLVLRDGRIEPKGVRIDAFTKRVLLKAERVQQKLERKYLESCRRYSERDLAGRKKGARKGNKARREMAEAKRAEWSAYDDELRRRLPALSARARALRVAQHFGVNPETVRRTLSSVKARPIR